MTNTTKDAESASVCCARFSHEVDRSHRWTGDTADGRVRCALCGMPYEDNAPSPSPPDLREQVARIIDPHFAKMLDRGELNQHGHEVWGLVLAKADDILALVAPPAGRREAGDLERLAELRFPDPVLTTAKQERNALIDRIISALKANPHA